MKRHQPMRPGSFLRSGMRKQPAADVSNESSGISGQLPDTGIPTSTPRRGTYGPATLKASPKTVEHRNPDLLALARGKKCLLHVLGICSCDSATVVACHSNMSAHGKSGARKADDHYSVWGCSACHRWLDQGPASYEVKCAYFMAAYAKQLIEWAKIAYDMSETPKARRAAEWALLQLQTKESNP